MESNNNIKLVGIDLGGTKVNVGLIQGNQIIDKKWDSIYLEGINNDTIRLPNKKEINFIVILKYLLMAKPLS